MVSPSKSTGRRRLMALGDHVALKSRSSTWRKYFKMERWYSEYETVFAVLGLGDGDSCPINGGCGTAACLLGHAPSLPIFAKAGLGNVVQDGYLLFSWKGETVLNTQDLYKLVFGIKYPPEELYPDNWQENYWLDYVFTEVGYKKPLRKVTPKMAVAQLRKVVKEIDKYHGWTF